MVVAMVYYTERSYFFSLSWQVTSYFFVEINNPNAMFMDADDTLLVSNGNIMNECASSGQEQINKVTSLCVLNKLTINIVKTKCKVVRSAYDKIDFN